VKKKVIHIFPHFRFIDLQLLLSEPKCIDKYYICEKQTPLYYLLYCVIYNFYIFNTKYNGMLMTSKRI